MPDNENLNTSAPEESIRLSRYYAARDLMDAGQLEQAIAEFHASALEHPHAKTFELLGECYLKLSRFKEAIPFLAASTGLKHHFRAPSLLAEAFLAIKEYSDAIRAAKIALAIEPNNRKARHILSIAIPLRDQQFPHLRDLDQNDPSKA